MTVPITRGLGGRRDVIILLVTLIIGLLALTWALGMRHRLVAPQGVPAAELAPEQIVKLGATARGPTRMVAFNPNERVRVMTYAAAQHPETKQWKGLPPDTLLKVTSLRMDGDDVWVQGTVTETGTGEPVVVHGSFLEPYVPLPLETIELADVKLISLQEGETARRSVSGWLRNVSSQTISQCVVTCVFRDRNEREVDVSRTSPLVLSPVKLMRFHTHMTDKQFASIVVQITHATPDGLRSYLPQVVIQKSSL